MRRLLVSVSLLLVCASYAYAQAVCPMEMLKDPKLTLADMVTKSEAKAKAWKPDVVVARITNTSLGPLDEAGKSEAWNVVFYSPSAKALVSITTFRGMFNCYADSTSAGRVPDLKPTFMRDGAKLYAIAKQNGGEFLSQGYIVQLGTAAAPDTRHATWNITFTKNNRNAPVMILVDANTGTVEKVIKD